MLICYFWDLLNYVEINKYFTNCQFQTDLQSNNVLGTAIYLNALERSINRPNREIVNYLPYFRGENFIPKVLLILWYTHLILFKLCKV